jgi:hypothetical protein
MKAKVGDKIIVTGKFNGHRFSIGDVLTVLKINKKKGGYMCTDDEDIWWLEENEFDLV